MVAANPVLQGAHVVQRALVQQGIDRIESLNVRKYASTVLVEMLQGTGPSFAILQGACVFRLCLVPSCQPSLRQGTPARPGGL